jgi:tRNA dimethylallyltransferase
MHRKGHLIVVAGPTAVGKTKLAIALGQHYECEIVSADGRQFYKEMSIGTAKPTEKELAQVNHHFINNKSINELYGAGHYEKEVIPVIEKLLEQHPILILVGGSGLYINAVLNGVDEFEEVPPEVREKLNQSYQINGITWLQEELKKSDPTYFAEVDIQNPQRIIRALEIIQHTGKPFSEFRSGGKVERSFNVIPLFINSERKSLYEHINKRVEEMMKAGLLDEVKNLYSYRQLNALKTVGYSELFDFIEGKCSLTEAVDKIKQRTRQYAKRQITWFKHQGEFEVFAPDALEQIKAYIDIIRQHV